MPEAAAIEEPLLRYARLLDLKEAEARRIQARIDAARDHDEHVSLMTGAHRVDPRLADLERKLQQALRELAALVGEQTLPPGLGDDATDEKQPTSDEATEGLFRAVRSIRAGIISKLRPDLASRTPELSPEELEAEFEKALGGGERK